MYFKVVLACVIWMTCYQMSEGRIPDVTADQCSVSKTCFKQPETCTGQNDCDYFLSWKPVNHSGKSYLEVEATGKVKGATGYVAIGFSHMNQMMDAGVVGCQVQSAGQVAVKAAYNIQSCCNNVFVNTSSQFLVTSGPDSSNSLGGFFLSTSQTVVCRFRRILRPLINAPQLKDLTPPNSYYILVALDNAISPQGFPHHTSKAVSSSSFVVGASNFSDVSQNAKIMIKIHGGLMMAAWLMCASFGIIMARYMKYMWASKTMGGQKIWFQLHRGSQILCVILTAAAFVVIFVEAGGYSNLSQMPELVHPILGIIVMALALLNPFIALFRPSPDATNRPIFNWIHFLIGSLAQILSVATMFIGIKIDKLGSFTSSIYPFWILVGYVAFIVVMEIVFSIDYHCTDTKSRGAANHVGIDASKGLQRHDNSGESSNYIVGVGLKDNAGVVPPNHCRRLFLLCIHCIGILGCTVALIVMLITMT